MSRNTTRVRTNHLNRTRQHHAPRVVQLTLSRRGGARPGAGRKPKGDKPMVSHDKRPALTPHLPVLITLKLEKGLPNLRRPATTRLLHTVFRIGGDRHGLRLVHFSIQSNHIHALVEARDTHSLSRGMQGLTVRIARGLNRTWNRSGRVLADRFHARILRTPREVRHAIAYVLHNARKHGAKLAGIDPHSSGPAFNGRAPTRLHRAAAREPTTIPVVPAHSWLLARGWRKHGLIGIDEVPGPRS